MGTLYRAKSRDDLREHILSRCVVDQDTQCWLWQGAAPQGYGILISKHLRPKVPIQVHRAMYILTVGEPEGHLHHICERPLCCNPQHLLDVTPREHMRLHYGDVCVKGHDPNWKVRSGKRTCLTCDRERVASRRKDPVLGARIREQDRAAKRRKRMLSANSATIARDRSEREEDPVCGCGKRKPREPRPTK